MQIITVAVQKGGTGKTTTAAALAQAAVYRGCRTLAIDLDPQGNLSMSLAARMINGTGNSYNLLMGLPPADLIQTTKQGIDVIPAYLDLATITSGKGSARRLQRALEPIKDNYDFIVIDTPTAAELQYNALQAATGLLIPLQADSFNIQSLYQINYTARQIRKSNPELSVKGVIMTNYSKQTKHARQIRELIQQQAEEMKLPYLGEIRRAIAIQEAATFRQSLFEYAPKSKPAADYLALFDKLNGGSKNGQGD